MIVAPSSDRVDGAVRGSPRDASTLALTSHAPILIDGNAGFTNASGVVWGSGTESDPYIIEGWDISPIGGLGIRVQNTSARFVVRSCSVHDGGVFCSGIHLLNCTNGMLVNNSCSNNGYGITLEQYSSNNTLSDNICQFNYFADMKLDSCSSNSLFNNTCSFNTGPGIFLYRSNENDLIGNYFNQSNGGGISLDASSNNSLINNTCTSSGIDGISLNRYSNNNIVANNTCSNNRYGIYLYMSSSNNTIVNNTCTGNYYGIDLELASNNEMTKNTCSMNDDAGIYLEGSDNCTMLGNICDWNYYYGINVRDSSNCSLVSNVCQLVDGEGIQIYSNDCRAFNNTCISSLFGMTIHNGLNATLAGNSIIGMGLMVLGDYLWSFNTHTIDATNTVNGRPFNYFKDMSGGAIPLCEGPILLANCSNVIVEDQSLDDIAIGVELAYCTGIVVDCNIWIGNAVGVYLVRSDNCTLTDNTCFNNYWYGMSLEYSDNNVVKSNWIENSTYFGIAIWWATGNMVWNNTLINNNGAGDIYDWDHVQAIDDGAGNFWNSTDGYGNYWSDWTGPDLVPPFGIVDQPYQVWGDADSHDNYPLTTAPTEPIPEFGMIPFIVMAFLAAIFLTTRARRSG
jgi:parallel beta-helix repeat protein